METIENWQRLYPWLLLHLLPGLGPGRIQKLLVYYPDPQEFLKEGQGGFETRLPQSTVQALQSLRSGRGDFWDYQNHACERIRNWLDEPSRAVLTLTDPRYPSLLKEIADPPPLLYVQGSVDVLAEPQLGVVGSRKPTHQGAEIALEFAYQLSLSGINVTSGLALGIDAKAHQGALRAEGNTIAVMGCGLEQIYPRQNSGLAAEIVNSGGALVSEFPLDMPPRAGNFPKRNRIISGMSVGVLVVEAEMKSGSLVTARLAAEQGREVFAVPGSIRSPLSKGCHHLINEGAQLVEGIDSILMALNSPFLQQAIQPELQSELQSEIEQTSTIRTNTKEYTVPEKQLLDSMGNEVCCLDLLVVRCGKPVSELLALLQQLELDGVVRRVTGGYERRYESTE